ncbi:MAG: sulfite exporter TauE/SafE family protein [Alphaproteobacteria bacterium]|nr:sulfite exporter TauE/SafE family protein [Alphaproteobacteria bacterium]HPF45307.1 sulfite exporter TauE/SafE family protein [Emcibacteraceae bacterium]HRW28505.1 sulfite exporter TauE/SafE family protein [Emcibacteraceae bacterium]
MQIYLPIAELSMNIFVLLAMGGGVGFLSGIFGVGGGFLMTPLLIFSGVPPAIAVASQASQITAASVSGAVAHWRRGGVDFKMGLVLIGGGVVGTYFGTMIFTYLREIGQVDLMISLAYVVFLGGIGFLMFIESIRRIIQNLRGITPKVERRQRTWIDALPFKMRFRKSKMYISVIMPLAIGGLVGVLSAIMGVGGGFVMIPAMIYLLHMPTNVVIGTSLLQITFVTAATTYLHSINTQTVDVVLAMVLLTAAVIGAQVGVIVGAKLKGEQLRILLASMVLIVCAKMAYDLVVEPKDLFTVSAISSEGL